MNIEAGDLFISFIGNGSNWFPKYNGVRITHLPTGLSAESTDERSQHRNHAIAMEELRKKLDAYVAPAATSYEAWRITYQSSEQAARAAFAQVQELHAALEPFGRLLKEHHANKLDAQPLYGVGDSLITIGDVRRACTLTGGKHDTRSTSKV